MRRCPIALFFLIVLSVGCGRRDDADVWRIFDECTACYNASDTTDLWPDALKRAESLAMKSGDSAVVGELYYQKACYDISRGEGDSVGVFLEKALACYGASDNNSGKAKAGLTYAQYLNMLSDYDNSEKQLRNALKYASGNDSLRALISAELMFLRISAGDMRGAVEYGNIVLPLLEQSGDTSSYIVACGNAGVAYRRLGMNDSAMIVYQKGLDMALRFKDYESTSFLLNNLSVLYCEQERYGESLQYARRAAQFAEKAGASIEYFSALANEGITYSKMGNDEKAASLLRHAYDECETVNYYPVQLKIINHLLTAYMNLQRYDSAACYLSKGEELSRLLPPGNNGAAGILEAKANLQKATGDYRGALATIKRLESLAGSNIVVPEYKLNILKAECLAGLADFRAAYRLAYKANEGMDSVRSSEAERKLSEYTARFRTQEKELEISRLMESNLRQESRITKLTAAIIVVFTMIALFVVWMLFRRRSSRQKTEIMLSRKYIDGLESERSRFARELHDGVCNDLLALAIDMKSGKSGGDATFGRIEAIRDDLRRISHEMMPPSFKHADIDEILSDYLSNLPSGSIKFHYHSSGGEWRRIPSGTAYELYRITQEAVSNIIRHSGASEASVSLSLDDGGNLSLVVKDNGSWQQKNDMQSGIGTRTISDRVASIGGEIECGNGINGSKLSITLKITGYSGGNA